MAVLSTCGSMALGVVRYKPDARVLEQKLEMLLLRTHRDFGWQMVLLVCLALFCVLGKNFFGPSQQQQNVSSAHKTYERFREGDGIMSWGPLL